jgi:Mn-dependent DtxR family transcriptional regulator
MERRSRAPWAWRTLELIGRRPHVRAADLARTLARERAPFKADVRRLKRLGLTRSHEVGYELTALGRAVLRTREPGKRSGKERGG